MPSTILRPTRRVSAVVAAATLATLVSIGAAPALAADAPWSPTPAVVTDGYGDATSTVVAPNGSITTVTEAAFGVVAATSTDGGASWQPSIYLNTSGNSAFRPSIAVTSSGLLAAAWVEDVAFVRSAWVSVSADGGASWGAPVALPTIGTYVDDPIVASTAASSFTIAWTEDWDKYTSTSTDAGVTWGAPQTLTIGLNSNRPTELVPVGPNEIVAIFQEFEGMSAIYSIQSRRSTDGGQTWGPKVAVSDLWSGSLSSGLFVGTSSPSLGTLVAVWTHDLPGNVSVGLFASTSSDGGASWSAPVTISGDAAYLRYFSVKTISSTSAGVLWLYETDTSAGVAYATIAVGASSASLPVTITTTTTAYYDNLPSFATLGSTRVTSWYQEEEDPANSGYHVSASCDAGATWTIPVVLAIGEDIRSNDAATVVSGSNFITFWSAEDTTPTGISIQSALSTTPCGVAAAAVDGELAATGSNPWPLLVFAILALGLGAVFSVTRLRAARS